MSTPFDLCIITAANEQQARGYGIQLEWRRRKSLLPDTEFKIIADPNGRRIGSGGSTFYVLNMLYKEYGDSLLRQRVLLLHSGGDSRRLPAYSVVGKLFAPLPTEEHYALFDVMLENYAQLPALDNGQLIIVSGDVLLNFDAAFINFSATGVTGVAYPDAPEQGRSFGVYVVRRPQREATPADDVLQKPDPAELQTHNAIDFANRIWVDTGILNLAPDAVRAFLQCRRLLDDAARGDMNYNLYHEILYAIAGKMDIPDANVLSRIPLFANCLPYCGFYHVGRSRELLRNYYALTHAALQYHFKNGTRSNAEATSGLEEAWVFNSVIRSPDIAVASPCLIEACLLDAQIKLEGGNILTNVPANSTPIHLQKDICLNVLPLQDGAWAAVLYGVEDQFKGKDSTFLNRPFAEFMAGRAVPESTLWDKNDSGDIWSARLFPACQSPDDAIRAALAMQAGENVADWRKATRLSMQDILQDADQQRLLQHHADIEQLSVLLTLAERLDDKTLSFEQINTIAKTKAERRLVADQLAYAVNEKKQDPLASARIHYWLGKLETKPDNAEPHFSAAFAHIRRAVGRGLEGEEGLIQSSGLAIQSDQVAWVMLPARFDFAGGWTDTPPICLERGGCVLNASITLNGQYPIQVIGKIRPNDFSIGVNSIDLAQRATISTFAELLDHRNPADWLSLPKAAFFASGLFQKEEQKSLRRLLKNIGGGIDLTLFSALPAGSGLGTSSILGAGIIAALARMMGVDMSRQELFARTSNMEQLLTTGGGWQDHIGGVAGGVKLIVTSPGYDQTPTLSWAQFNPPGKEMRDHFLLYYTGYRRMAKNLLRQVVGRYLERQPVALDVLTEMAELARSMKSDIDHRRMEAFGRKLGRSWQLNKMLDSGQTTADIEAILARIDDYILGAKLLGAGGGGFLFIAARDAGAAAKIRQELTNQPPNDRARFFDFDIDADGMKITVL